MLQPISLGAVDKTNATRSSTIDDTIPEIWAQETEDFIVNKRFMSRFTVKKTDLIAKAGDTINIFKGSQLTAAGDLTETSVLEGNEEQLSFSKVAYTPAKKGNAVRATAEADATSILNIRQEARDHLGDWAANKRDLLIHESMRSGVTQANTRYAGDSATAEALDGSDKMTPAELSQIRWQMEADGIPKFAPGASPGMNSGYFMGVFHPYQVYDLTQHADYKSAADNVFVIQSQKVIGPQFQGFDAFWDGIMVWDTANIQYDTGGGYSVKVARSFIFGRRALGEATGIFRKGPGLIWKEKLFDYDQDLGIAVIFYVEAKVLNSDQIYALYTAATDLSGA